MSGSGHLLLLLVTSLKGFFFRLGEIIAHSYADFKKNLIESENQCCRSGGNCQSDKLEIEKIGCIHCGGGVAFDGSMGSLSRREGISSSQVSGWSRGSLMIAFIFLVK